MSNPRPATLSGADKVPDSISLSELCRDAAKVLSKAGFDHRIDIYREVEIEDPTVRMMLGRAHRVRVRLKITASSLLFEEKAQEEEQEPAQVLTRSSKKTPGV